ncbi:MAG TPA: hypothetical protein DIW43_01050 [Spongiibacteraceae bacterium]|nr:hypothetical protein [Spongiibacteraceae bacterium]HCS26007.1 hypothetical protein [Spongiibacteraceae bacterium]|tara:strand:+ start:1478 stop:2386 length:909 start_codon:yes stop_codon:yes gene_type:complete
MASANRKKPDENRKKVMQRLHDEHAYIGSLRKAMAAEVAKLRRRGDPDLVILRDMMRYLMEYPDVHHHPLEDKIFAKLVKHSGGVRAVVLELLAEHKDLAKESQYLYHKLDALVLGDDKLQKNLLRARLTEFMELYDAHVRCEETVVFPAAEKFLSSGDWREIADRLPSIDDSVFGMSGSEQYARLRRRVAERVDAAMMDVAISETLGVYALLGAIGAFYEGAEELKAFNSQQFSDVKQANYTLFRDSDSLSEALSKVAKVNGRLIGKGWSQRLNIISKTARAVYLPFSENFRMIITSRSGG